jgi:NAD(P)-dependent dehydrogenase (short-subunit alcohol dehydrogenase family)
MKTVVITGSTRGIGHGLAVEFLKRGCAVVISGRKKTAVETEVQKLAQIYGKDRVAGVPCEVTDLGQVQALWDGAKKIFGTVDIWINNAGITHTTRLFANLDPLEISPVVNTNITGLAYGCRVALQGMQEQGAGQIYNFEGHGSDGRKRPGLLIYGTTKRAVRYFTEALIEETEGGPVQVCFLSPGIVVTDFLIDDMRKMSPDDLETTKAVYNCLADTVETVTPFLADEVLKNFAHGIEIAWLTDEKANERFSSDEYCSRDLFSRHGL